MVYCPAMDALRVLLLLLGALVAVGLGLWLAERVATRRYQLALPYVLEERLATGDGSFIELRRLPPGATPVDLPPVLLVHGLGANHRNNDLSLDLSLARFLSTRGRDVWLLTLRSGVLRRSFAETRRTRFDAMVREDLPLGVREVLERTERPALDYVGFSMGGMLLYAAIGRTVEARCFRKIAIIGSPAVVRAPLRLPVPRIVGWLPAAWFPTLRLRFGARAGVFAIDRIRTFAHHWVHNPDNVAPGVARVALVNVIEDVPGPLNFDFAVWAASKDGRLTFEGKPVEEGLELLSTPVLFFAGGVDRLAPPSAVRAAFDAWGRGTSVDKRFVLLSKESGARADYGHGDLAVGAHVRDDVFEPIAQFFEEG